MKKLVNLMLIVNVILFSIFFAILRLENIDGISFVFYKILLTFPIQFLFLFFFLENFYFHQIFFLFFAVLLTPLLFYIQGKKFSIYLFIFFSIFFFIEIGSKIFYLSFFLENKLLIIQRITEFLASVIIICFILNKFPLYQKNKSCQS